MIRRSLVLWQSVLYAVVPWVTSYPLKAEMKQLLTPQACTEIRYLDPDEVTNRSPLQLSPDGKQVAYVLQVPDVAANDNKEELYVSAVGEKSDSIASPVLTEQLVTAAHWFPDNKHLTILVRRNGKTVLARVDSTTKAEEIIYEAKGNITDYSIDAVGKTIAIAVRIAGSMKPAAEMRRDDRKGYRLDIASTAHPDEARRQIYILRQNENHHWTAEQPLEFVSPLSGRVTKAIVDHPSAHITLSPNGQYLLMDDLEHFSAVSERGVWGRSLLVKYLKNRGYPGLVVSYLYDLHTHTVSMPLESPIVRDGLWAPDSKSYVKVALAPAASRWEADDLEKDTPNDHITHLFSVDVPSGKVTEVLNRAEKVPVAWTEAGDIIVRYPVGTLATLRKESDHWMQTGSTRIPLPSAAPYSPMASDGRRVIIENEDARTAPELVAFDQSAHTWIVARLNPQVDNLVLPQAMTITWTTSTGYTAKGLLLLPPDYDPHRRYPLVIEDGSILYTGEFVCDSGVAHVPSFARGILADAGIMYLTRYWPGNNDWESNYYPKGYPGTLAEAAFKLDLVESAVRTLNQRQMIDPNKVGLIGFSRGGWYVDYALSHSQVAFQAASATDNIQYSLGEYWYRHNEATFRMADGMYGGPPYGNSLQSWLDYSISFNLDKIHTPLLMEVMGYGKKYEDPAQPPDNLAVHNEIFVGLSSLKKPVELYYYPNEQHQPDHPQARIASLQRNVDWYRFWLQDYEDSDPAKEEQYKRWEHLRELREADMKAATGQTQTGKVN
jgi:dipeptidyl aminopeptidase/acylaminoacyl peptidase